MKHYTLAFVAVVLCAAGLLASAAWAGSDPAMEAFFQAQKMETTGQYEQAMAEYEKMAVDFPQSVYAGEALFRVAVILDEQLYDPPSALKQYRRYLDLYGGRQSKRAHKRMEALGQYENVDVAAYRKYIEAVNSYSRRDPALAKEKMRVFIQEYPDYQRLDDALLWLANETRGFARGITSPQDRENIQEAIPLYDRVVNEYPGTRNSLIALKNLGDCYRLLNKWQLARETYRRVIQEGGDFGKTLVGQYYTMTNRDISRTRLFYGTTALALVLAVVLGFSIPFSRASLAAGLKKGLVWDLFFLPLGVILVGATYYFTDPLMGNIKGQEPWLVAVFMAMAMVLVLISAVAVEADREKGVKGWVFAPVLAGLTLCMIFGAFYLFDLMHYVEELVL